MSEKTVELSDVKVSAQEAAIKQRETARTLREAELKRQKNYKPIFFGLDSRDLAISTVCLLTLYGLVIGIFILFQYLVESNKPLKNNDGVLWTWFTFGLLYFFVVFGAIATAEPIKFEGADDKVGVTDGNGKSVE